MKPCTLFSLAAWGWAASVYGQLHVTDDTTLAELSSTLVGYGFQNLTALLGANGADSVSSLATRSTTYCSTACSLIKLLLPGQTNLHGSSGYTSEQGGYWSQQQEEVSPACFVQPTEAIQVSAILLIAEFTQCTFSAKGGGHAAFAGASNTPDGVTIDFGKMKTISVSADKSTTTISAGNIWQEVYEYLEPRNLLVIGGRVSGIGTGLILGGGISFYSGLYGWACDNVKSYELVTASGLILDVTEESYPDLYWALRGGGNQFGLVTSFELYTYPLTGIWGGSYVVLGNYISQVMSAFQSFAYAATEDPHAALIIAVAYAEGTWVVAVDIEYVLPIANPPIYDNFTAIPAIENNLRIGDLTDFVEQYNASNPSGLRELYSTATFAVSAELLDKLNTIFQTLVEEVADAAGLVPALVWQPITLAQIRQMQKNGGNALGLVPEEAPLMLANVAIMWESASDDARISALNQNWQSQAQALAKSMGLSNKYFYMNYADKSLDIYDGYNATNKARLLSVSEKYDPFRVFSTLETGYFVLD